MEEIRGKTLKEWKEYSEKDNDIPIRTAKYITILEERIKQLLIQRVSFSEERVEVCDHCGISPKEFAGLCYKCADDLAME